MPGPPVISYAHNVYKNKLPKVRSFSSRISEPTTNGNDDDDNKGVIIAVVVVVVVVLVISIVVVLGFLYGKNKKTIIGYRNATVEPDKGAHSTIHA